MNTEIHGYYIYISADLTHIRGYVLYPPHQRAFVSKFILISTLDINRDVPFLTAPWH